MTQQLAEKAIKFIPIVQDTFLMLKGYATFGLTLKVLKLLSSYLPFSRLSSKKIVGTF